MRTKTFLILFFLGGIILASYAQSNSKKGACISSRKHPDYKEKVKKLNVSWHYSWGADLLDVPKGVEFVPMIWSVSDNPKHRAKIGQRIKTLKAAKSKKNAPKYLLGYNEPDRKMQANMTVEQALEYWPKLISTGYQLGSPSPHTDSPWMKEFMEKAKEKKYRVDFVCVHFYGGPNAKSFLNKLKKYYGLYKKPIWITEFACADWNAKSLKENRLKKEKIQAFMKEVLPALDKMDFVERYAWFPFDEDSKNGGPSALFHKDGNLTELGKIYAAHGSKKE